MKKTIYGRCSAVSAWTNRLAGVFVAMGMQQHVAFPTLFKSTSGLLRISSHMDGGYGAGARREIAAFSVECQQRVKATFGGPSVVGYRCSFLGGEREMAAERDCVQACSEMHFEPLEGLRLGEL